jgi:hypothetical protein
MKYMLLIYDNADTRERFSVRKARPSAKRSTR